MNDVTQELQEQANRDKWENFYNGLPNRIVVPDQPVYNYHFAKYALWIGIIVFALISIL